VTERDRIKCAIERAIASYNISTSGMKKYLDMSNIRYS